MIVEAVVPARFPAWVRSKPFQVLFLGSSVSSPRPPAVLRGLDLNWPGRLGAGWMVRDSVTSLDWWERNWITELGPSRPLPPPLGVWLFHHGWVAGHHPGTAHATDAGAVERVREYLIDRIRLKIASEEAAASSSWSAPPPGPGKAAHERLPPPPAPRAPEPYEVLEVSPQATDDEVKAAYRTALKLNHPDKVAHLSRQIQEFAKERTQLIVAAWQAVKAERGIR